MMFRELYKYFFKDLDVNLDFGSNGVDGLKLIRENGIYKIIICNLFMPIMDGVNFCNEICTHGYYPNQLIMLHELEPDTLILVTKEFMGFLKKNTKLNVSFLPKDKALLAKLKSKF